MQLPLDRGLDLSWLSPSESDTVPVVNVTGTTMTVPCFVKEGTREEEDPETKEKKTKVVYSYYPVELEYKGDATDNPYKVMRNRWDEFREYFYGPAWFQTELEAKGLWTPHAMAVRAVFPKVEGEIPTALENFWEAYTNFWTLISQTCQQYSIPYESIPDYFDSTYLLTIASQYGITGDALSLLVTKMQLIQFDVLANKFVWKNLFPKPAQEEFLALL